MMTIINNIYITATFICYVSMKNHFVRNTIIVFYYV